jgi:oligopeptide transport system substrate-binding protein
MGPRLAVRSLLLAVVALTLVPGASHAARATTTELSVNLGTTPSSLDPGRASYVEDLIVANAIFTPLYRSPGGSSGRLVPHLAAGAPTVSSGGRRYTVRLRSARWSDGRPILASDVVFAFQRARRSSVYGAEFTAVRSARAIGPRTVQFDLSTPVPWFGELLASTVTTPIPAHLVRKQGTKWTRLDRIVTSGPFRPVSGRGHTELVLERNARWWGASRVRIERIKLLAVSQAAASPLFRARRLDIGLRGTSVHPSALESWSRDPRFSTVASGGAQYLYLNTRAPELANPAVRRAIAIAIDRDALAGITADGVDRPLESIVPDGVRGFAGVVPTGSTLLREDGLARPFESATLLAAAGWTSANRLALAYPNDGGFSAQVATAIATQLAAAGVSTTLRPLSTSDFFKVGVGISPVADGIDMVLQGWVPEYSDPQSFHQLFACSAITAGINASNFCSEQYDAALAAAAASSGASRIQAHRAVESLLTGPEGLMPAVPLYEPVGTLLVQPWVRGFTQHPSGLVEFEKVSLARSSR